MPRGCARFFASLVLSLTACGGDDRTDEEVPPIRACDYRAGQNPQPRCTEWGPGRGTDGLHSACIENDGDWSHDACPPDERLGCCSFESNGSVRDCFYAGETADQETACVEIFGGSWAPD